MPGVFDPASSTPSPTDSVGTTKAVASPTLEAPHFAFPFQMSATAIVVEQDTDEEIIQTASMVLYYEIGERLAIPTYGVRDQALRMGGPDLTEIRSSIEEWDDRVRSVVTSEADVQRIAHNVTIDIERDN